VYSSQMTGHKLSIRLDYWQARTRPNRGKGKPRPGRPGLNGQKALPLNCLLSLFGWAIATLGTYQRPTAIDRPTLGRGPAMSGVAIFGLAALSALLAVNLAIAVAAVILGRR